MVSQVTGVTKVNKPRISQLYQRSNQFNLRADRCSYSDVQRIQESDDYVTFAFTLEDEFGDNSLISIVVLKRKHNRIIYRKLVYEV